MPVLSDKRREDLAKAIGKENASTGARIIAEEAARAAIKRLGVDQPAAPAWLGGAEKDLRRKLRARARQLGDALYPDASQEIRHLVEACAYEHWHRMLFARFLADNDLLIHPVTRQPVSLADCVELAEEEGAADRWEIAGLYASKMLKEIFRPEDPLLWVKLANEDQRRLEAILDDLPDEVFKASDALGWSYQFWQAKKKKEVNESEAKIGADEIGPVTQLFTEPYMVSFLLENTLGAWWIGAGRRLPDGLEMPLLRFLEDGTPAAGRFEGWPRRTAELKMLDPCCGSGHFLVAALPILTRFRMAEEGLDIAAACDAVLKENLHGLEIDNRCVQIAAFALALESWKLDSSQWRPLARFNLACSGISVAEMPIAGESEAEKAAREAENVRRRERWMAAGGKELKRRHGMGRLFDLFAEAPAIGSLIDPVKGQPDRLLCAPAEELIDALRRVVDEDSAGIDPDEHETHVAAYGVTEAARLLGSKYHVIATNVPFLARGKQGDALKRQGDSHYQKGQSDLCTMFLERIANALVEKGAAAVVTPQNWMQQSSYSQFRKHLLTTSTFLLLGDVGPAAFSIMNWWAFNTSLSVISNQRPTPGAMFSYLNASAGRDPEKKSKSLKEVAPERHGQAQQLENPGWKIAPLAKSSGKRLSAYAFSPQGIKTGDDARYRRYHWEQTLQGDNWAKLQSSPAHTEPYGGRDSVVCWKERGYELARRQGNTAWGQRGVAIGQMNNLPATLYCGDVFDSNVSPIVPTDGGTLPAIWCFCSSPEYLQAIRRLDQTLKVPNSVLVQIPFDAEHWTQVAAARYPSGLPEPYSDDPTQWLFQGDIASCSEPLHVAVARLLGFRWPDQPEDEHIDKVCSSDGILCLPSLRGSPAAEERLKDLLRLAYGSGWSTAREQTLRTGVKYANGTLGEWLREDFFRQHCTLFRNLPFIWQVWDGHKDGFSALVNYHRLDHKALESLTFTYLGEWIARQRDAETRDEAGAVGRREAAERLQNRLKDILEGEAPYDIFVRWKPKEAQPIGWRPDLDDGVRLNIRPFFAPLPGAKDRGPYVLRELPHIKWGKDRGKNPPGSPWGEERNNDLHLSLAEKREARSKAGIRQPDEPDDDEGEHLMGPRLRSLRLVDTGPIHDASLEFGTRLNLLTGDNSLGKTFLLDVIWWALTGAWPVVARVDRSEDRDTRFVTDRPRTAEPRRLADGSYVDRAELLVATDGEPIDFPDSRTFRYDLAGTGWKLDKSSQPKGAATGRFSRRGPHGDFGERVRPTLPGVTPSVVIYARADMGISVFDPLRNRPERVKARTVEESKRLPAFQYGPDEWLRGAGSAQSGLLTQWSDWRLLEDERWKLLTTLLRLLSPHGGAPLTPGPPVNVLQHDRDVPSLVMPYGLVPITLSSAGTQRIVTLAYVLVWAWTEHHRAAELLGQTPCKHLSLIIDEVEVHLHPQWQRVILSALMDALEMLSPKPDVQVFVATHSPLVLASVETRLDEDTDRIFHLQQEEGEISTMDIPAIKQGDVVNWLTSEVFGLTQARSVEAERAIEAAEAFMRGEMGEVPEDLRSEGALQAELMRVLPGDDYFWPRWVIFARRGKV